MKKIAATESLPHEMIVEILSWLPVKSLLKFRCVSKPWCASISDHNFVKSHFHRSIETNKSNFLVVGEPGGGHSFDYHFHYNKTGRGSLEGGNLFDKLEYIHIPFSEFRILGSCDGIIFLGAHSYVCLLNPATRDYKVVQFEKGIVSETPPMAAVAYGIFYDPDREEFNVVAVVYHNTCDKSNMDFDVDIHIDPLSNTSGSIMITRNTPYVILNDEHEGIYLSGAFHWIALHKISRAMAIVSFDIMEKVFQEVPPPSSLCKDAFLSLGVSQGKLCMLSCSVEDSDMDMWMMNTYGAKESWSKLYSIEHSVVPSIFCRNSLSFTINGEVLIQGAKDSILYDPKQKKAKDVKNHLQSDEMIVSHIASLMPLKPNTKLDSITQV